MIFPEFDGQIVDRGDYLAIRTPANPTFYWGNFLLFRQPPQEGDFVRWRELFTREIGSAPEVHHQAFGWDSPEGDVGYNQPFIQAGFTAIHDVVLTTGEPRPCSNLSPSIDIRALRSESEWSQALNLQVLCREPEHVEAGYRVFRQRAMERYRRMVQAGLGDWYGAFLEGRLVADLGIFHQGDLGRYQSVETHPDFRRQGIAGSMIYEAGKEAIARYGMRKLVIVAEAGGSPARLYESLGFQPTEKSVGVLWWDRDDPGTGNGT